MQWHFHRVISIEVTASLLNQLDAQAIQKYGLVGVLPSPPRMRLRGKFRRNRLVEEERRKTFGYGGAVVFAIFGKDEVLSPKPQIARKYYIAHVSSVFIFFI